MLALKAEVLHFAGRTAEALAAVQQAEAEIERSEVRWWCSELHRLRGVFLAASGANRKRIDSVFAELITLDAITPKQGVGTALIEALASRLQARGVTILRVTTTNDNLDALRFYQRRGFRITVVRPGAVDEARRLKPSIPAIGDYGIPIRDELELERQI
jgi:GNAT superfamily N-acetyltransferase